MAKKAKATTRKKKRQAKAKPYDDDALVAALAASDCTYAVIAERFGVSEDMVASIACGRRRGELRERIDAITDGYLDQARRLGKRLAMNAMAQLGKLLSCGEPAVERHAAETLLKWNMGDPGKPEMNVTQHAGLPGDYTAYLDWRSQQKD